MFKVYVDSWNGKEKVAEFESLEEAIAFARNEEKYLEDDEEIIVEED